MLTPKFKITLCINLKKYLISHVWANILTLNVPILMYLSLGDFETLFYESVSIKIRKKEEKQVIYDKF